MLHFYKVVFMIKKMELNFLYEQKTLNDHFYDWEVLKKEFTKKVNVFKNYQDAVTVLVDDTIAIGFTTGNFSIDENGKVFIEVDFKDSCSSTEFDKKITTYGKGNLVKDNIIENFVLNCFFISEDE